MLNVKDKVQKFYKQHPDYLILKFVFYNRKKTPKVMLKKKKILNYW